MKKFFFAFLLLAVSSSFPVLSSFAKETPKPEVDEPLSPVDATKAVLTGTAEPGASVIVTGGVYEVAPVTADSDGKFSITVALVQESSNTFYIQAQLSGWAISGSTEVTIIEGEEVTSEYEDKTGEDHTAPAAPEFDETDIETDEATYTLEGTAEAKSTVWVNGEESDETVDSNGSFSIELALSGGDTKDTFSISVADKSGNLSAATKVTITSSSEEAGELEETGDKTLPIDVVGHWAEDYINRLYQDDVVSGYSTGLFGPDDKLTRAQIVKIALLAFGRSSDETSNSFSDISSSDWFYGYVLSASNLDIVSGYSDSTFRPNQEVTRGEALKIILITAGLTDFTSTESNFSDVLSSDWFSGYSAYAKEIGLIGGYSDGTFRGNQSITRAEVCKIVVELLDYLETQN